jgi:hypothetical protein
MHLVQRIEQQAMGPCDKCGGYQCAPCEECGNMLHVYHNHPFCPHGFSTMKSGFAEVYDVQTGIVVTGARMYDKHLKSIGAVIDDGGYKAKEAAAFRVEQQKKTEDAFDAQFNEAVREAGHADAFSEPAPDDNETLYVEPNSDLGAAEPELKP